MTVEECTRFFPRVACLLLVMSCCHSECLAQSSPVVQDLVLESPKNHEGKLRLSARLDFNPFASSIQPPDGKTVTHRPGEMVDLVISGQLEPGFHSYPVTIRTPGQDVAMLSSIRFAPGGQLIPVWPVIESGPTRVFEEAFDLDAKLPTAESVAKIRVQVCDEKGCTWGEYTLRFRIAVAGPPVPNEGNEILKVTEPPIPKVDGNQADTVANARKNPITHPPLEVTRVPVLPRADEFEEVARYAEGTINDVGAFKEFLQLRLVSDPGKNDDGLIQFLIIGMFWGGISLVTPCVFPMIPVTVSIFLKQRDGSSLSPIATALIYCGTITLVLTLAAMLALSLFVWLSINWIFNTIMGLVFIFFALSLFGMYDIELPAWLTTWSSSNEQRGGAAGTVFMALTFSMLSFACVAPFLGGFGANSAGRPLVHQFLGGLAFSATFASPFFFLALFPGLLRKLPRSGTWLNTVKVTMGFVELMAAIKFFRLAEIREGTSVWFTYDFCMAATIAIHLACALYLFQFFSLPLDTKQECLGVIRMVFAMMMLTMVFYLLPGMFQPAGGVRNRPQGIIYAWVDSFLLPDTAPNQSGAGHNELPFTGDLSLALEHSRVDGKPVFIDFTGVTCTNCKLNEKQVFSKPDVSKLFEKFHLVQLYTDRVIPEFIPAEALQMDRSIPASLADAHATFRREFFQVEQLPFYVIVKPK